MKHKSKLFILTTIVGLAILYFMYSRMGLTDVIGAFKNFTIKLFIVYLIAVILIEFFLTLRWRVILNAFDMKVPFLNLYLYKMSGYAVGYVSPQAHVGGEPVRAILLKRHGIKFKDGISTAVIDKSMQLTTDLLFAFVGATLLFLHFSISRRIEIFVYGFILVALSVLGFYFYCMVKKKPFFSAILNFKLFSRFEKLQNLKQDILEVEETIHTFHTTYFKSFIKVVLINITTYLLMVVEYTTAIALFGFNPNIYTVLIVMGAVALSYSFPVPMALGVLEASQASALGILKINPAIGLSISLLIRVKDLIRTLIGGTALFHFGISLGIIWKQIKEDDKTPEKDSQAKKK